MGWGALCVPPIKMGMQLAALCQSELMGGCGTVYKDGNVPGLILIDLHDQ